MFFFFFSFTEKSIGIKKLTLADLGMSNSSNQTHIGLKKDVFSFLDDSDVVKEGLLVYENEVFALDCVFDRIENPDGTFRSPKIRKGDGNSIVEMIRKIANKKPNTNWYLVWSGLESEQLAFWLFNEESEDFKMVSKLFPSMSMVLTDNYAEYEEVKKMFLYKLNKSSTNIQKDIEIAAQTGRGIRRYNRIDIKKANELYERIGREGENLIADYLEKQKYAKIIESFRWMNKDRESGEPFDFIINEDLSSMQYIDVKATRFDFNQYVYYSEEEIKFVSELNNNDKYAMYRVFDMEEDNKKLSICGNCQDYITLVYNHIVDFSNKLNENQTILRTMKLGVEPQICFRNIQSELIL